MLFVYFIKIKFTHAPPERTFSAHWRTLRFGESFLFPSKTTQRGLVSSAQPCMNVFLSFLLPYPEMIRKAKRQLTLFLLPSQRSNRRSLSCSVSIRAEKFYSEVNTAKQH